MRNLVDATFADPPITGRGSVHRGLEAGIDRNQRDPVGGKNPKGGRGKGGGKNKGRSKGGKAGKGRKGAWELEVDGDAEWYEEDDWFYQDDGISPAAVEAQGLEIDICQLDVDTGSDEYPIYDDASREVPCEKK